MTKKNKTEIRRRARLLPAVIVVAVAVLAVRLGELSLDIDLFAAGPALAAEEKSESKPKKVAKAETDGGKAEEEGEDAAADGSDIFVDFTPAEVAVLQDLARRRDALLKLEKELDEREQLLIAAENRLDKRIAEMEGLRNSIEALVRQFDDQEQSELDSIVKIYETMKPKDAARILQDLELDILLGIMENMKERKSAAILSSMGAERARELTAEMARKRQIDLMSPPEGPKPSG